MPKLRIEELTVRYRVQGPEEATPPWVLLHGATAGQYVWQEQFDGLARTQRLVAPDLPGHGQSALPPRPYDIADHARVVGGLLEALDLGPAVLVGHSMGGAIAQQVTLDAPGRVAGLVLVATGAKLPVSDLVLGAIDQAFDTYGELLAQIAYGPDTPPALVDRYTRGPVQCNAATARADFEACAQFDVRSRLAEISCPCLILGGTADGLVGPGRWKQLEGGLADATLQVFDGAGHMVMQERAEAVNRAITSFVTERVRPERQRP